MIYRSNGLGGTTGDTLATCRPLIQSGNAWYVGSNVTGAADAAAPAGKDRQKPLLTLGQAITNSAAGDIIVLLDGHTEILTAVLAISKQLTIVGEGLSGGRPTANFTMNAAAADTFTVNQQGTELRNIWFKEASQTNTSAAKVNITASECRVVGCYFECGAKDQLSGILLGAGANGARLVNTTLISTATSAATRPTRGVQASAALADVELDGLILSDGTVGFSTAAWDSAAVSLTRLRGLSLSLLLGADMLLNATNNGSYLNPQVSTNGGRIEW